MKNLEKQHLTELNNVELKTINGGNWVTELAKKFVEDVRDALKEAGVIPN